MHEFFRQRELLSTYPRVFFFLLHMVCKVSVKCIRTLLLEKTFHLKFSSNFLIFLQFFHIFTLFYVSCWLFMMFYVLPTIFPYFPIFWQCWQPQLKFDTNVLLSFKFMGFSFNKNAFCSFWGNIWCKGGCK